MDDPVQVEVLFTAVGAFLVSVVLTGVMRGVALSYGVIDTPNSRSSHTQPTPRGGGASIVLALIGSLLLLSGLGVVDTDLLLAVAGGGAAVAIVGFIDDRRGVAASVRLVVHLGAAVWALAWLGGLPPMQIGDEAVSFGWFGYVLGALGIAWSINLFNFMDGIDGIAGAEAAFVAGGASVLALLGGGTGGVPASSLALAASAIGFLVWNWPPARIFMGDVGSGFVGYAIAVFALASAGEGSGSLLVWLTLGGVFFVDATVTLIRRARRRERLSESHRTHAYQWLSRRWGSHRSVTLAMIVVNVGWLFPFAWLVWRFPARGWWLVIMALCPLVVCAIKAGAGVPEAKQKT